MGFEERDFIIRQVQQLAEGIGKLLGKESVKELIQYDQSQGDALSDDDIETILLMVDVKDIQTSNQLSPKEISQEIGIAEADFNQLYNNERFATPSELALLRDYVEKNDL